jgi:glutamate---cysteine ligase / carboxylate-amine ligase
VTGQESPGTVYAPTVPLSFTASERHTLGVELELCLVDSTTRELTSSATAVLEDLAARTSTDGVGGLTEPHPKAKHELFECTVEIITGICETVSEARHDLAGTLAEVRDVARPRGLECFSAGTHPFSTWRDQRISPDERYIELVDELQWTARRLAIFGAHFHVGLASGDRAVAVANALRGYLPILLALSASSPYWTGEDSGLASARSKVFETLPTAGLNPHLEGWAEFEGLMDALIRAHCIRTIREVWWDVRPHPDFGTVELRMCDAPPTLHEVAALAALAQALVARLDERFDEGTIPDRREEWLVRENKWLAARHGIDARLITDRDGRREPVPAIVERLLAELEPTAATLHCRDELLDVRSILERGPSYARQRAVRAAGGSATDVVDHLVRELATGEVIVP